MIPPEDTPPAEGLARPQEDGLPDASAARPWPPLRITLGLAALVSLAVALVSRAVPDDYSTTAVAAIFLLASWVMVLRHNSATIRAYGLSLGGVTEPEPLDGRRLLRSSLQALGWAALFALLLFPPFWVGYRYGWLASRPDLRLLWSLPAGTVDMVMGQLLVVALPEEVFYRGFLQPALEGRWQKRWRIFGTEVGPGWLLSCAIFAVGHILTVTHPARLAVFFPALAFGWLRARTKGIGAAVVFHAACNLLSSWLAHAYGLV